MDLQLAGTTVLVTGAGQGLGRAIGLAFAAEGAHVAFHHHASGEGAEKAAAEAAELGVRAIAVGGDTRDAADVASIVERVESELGPIGVLVNNSAVTRKQRFLESTPEDWAPQIDVTVTGNAAAHARRGDPDGRPRRRVDREPDGRLRPGRRVRAAGHGDRAVDDGRPDPLAGQGARPPRDPRERGVARARAVRTTSTRTPAGAPRTSR